MSSGKEKAEGQNQAYHQLCKYFCTFVFRRRPQGAILSKGICYHFLTNNRDSQVELGNVNPTLSLWFFSIN